MGSNAGTHMIPSHITNQILEAPTRASQKLSHKFIISPNYLVLADTHGARPCLPDACSNRVEVKVRSSRVVS